jgi:hypothetical protein
MPALLLLLPPPQVLEAAALDREPQPLEEFAEDVGQYFCDSKALVGELLAAFKDKAGLDGGPLRCAPPGSLAAHPGRAAPAGTAMPLPLPPPQPWAHPTFPPPPTALRTHHAGPPCLHLRRRRAAGQGRRQAQGAGSGEGGQHRSGCGRL